MKNKFYFLLITSFLFSCENPQKAETEKSDAPKAGSAAHSSEKKIEKDLISIVKGINISNINQYIDPEKGLWLIQSSGAMPNMTNTSQVDKNFPVDFLNVKEEELPKVDCAAKIFWTKKGCYLQEINSFKNENLPAGQAGIWTYCGLSKEDEAKVAELAQSISLSVINTSLNARYYFSQVNGKWYLVFVDLREPCQA